MDQQNYFEYFEMEVSFLVDNRELKSRYLEKSRELHPDYHTLNDEATQEKMLELSSYNNLAYQTLKDPMSRLRYILELNNYLQDEKESSLPQEFLMEMMDINEAIMELSMDYEPARENELRHQIDNMEFTLKESILPSLERYDHNHPDKSDLEAIKDFYLKSRYLWRIKENLDKFTA